MKLNKYFLIILFLTSIFHDLNAKELIISNESIRPKIALVLSGGGARGLSQIGILKGLEENNIKIDYIVGTSMGAIIGGLYSTGYSALELDSMFQKVNWERTLSLAKKDNRNGLFLDQKILNDRNLFSLKFENYKIVLPEAISSNNELYTLLQNMIWNAPYKSFGNFDNLKYKFRAIATDLVSGQPITLSSGSMIKSVQASATLPLWYTPVRIDSMKLVDGGLKSNIPIEEAKLFNPDLIFVINTVSPLMSYHELNNPLKIADQVVTILMKDFENTSSDYVDITFSPQLGDRHYIDYSDISELIIAGKKSFQKKKNELNKVLHSFDILRKDSLKKEIEVNIDFTNNYKKNSNIFFTGFNSEDSLKIIKMNNGNLIDFLIDSLNEKEEIINILYSDDIEIKKYNIDYNRLVIKSINNINYEELLKILKRENLKNLNSIKDRVNGYFYENNLNFAFIRSIETENNKITILIDEGKLNKIVIKDNSYSNYLVKRELFVKEGEYITPKDLNKSWLNCKNSNFFTTVDFELRKNINSGIDLLIDAPKMPSQNLLFGGRIDNERNSQVSIDLFRENIFNFGERQNIHLVGGNRNFKGLLSFEVPRIWNTFYNFKLSTYYSYYLNNEYSAIFNNENSSYNTSITDQIKEVRQGLSFSLGSQLEKLGLFYLKYRLERQAYGYKENESNYSIISTGTMGLIIDTENKTNFPTSGNYINIFFESNLFGEEESPFTKFYINYNTHLSLGNHIISPKIEFGYADRTLPDIETFSIGGQDKFYGYREDEKRGRQLLITGLQYQYKLPVTLLFDTYFTMRYDLGSVWGNPEIIKFSGLNHGLGAGVGIDTPLGPANFDIGQLFYFTNNSYQKLVKGPLLFYFSFGMNLD